MYEVETRKREAKNFFAGEFPTLTESGTAGAAIKEHEPVMKDTDGNIVPVSAPEEGEALDVTGIAAADAEKGDPVVYYITGEFFTDAIILQDGVEVGALKDVLRKISIFLR